MEKRWILMNNNLRSYTFSSYTGFHTLSPSSMCNEVFLTYFDTILAPNKVYVNYEFGKWAQF